MSHGKETSKKRKRDKKGKICKSKQSEIRKKERQKERKKGKEI